MFSGNVAGSFGMGQSGDNSHLGRTIVRIQQTPEWEWTKRLQPATWITVYLNSARRDTFL